MGCPEERLTGLEGGEGREATGGFSTRVETASINASLNGVCFAFFGIQPPREMFPFSNNLFSTLVGIIAPAIQKFGFETVGRARSRVHSTLSVSGRHVHELFQATAFRET